MMSEQVFEARDFIMNTAVEQKIFGGNAEEIYRAALKELNRLEDSMSFYREKSEVSMLNRKAGRESVRLSEEMMAVLQEAKRCASLSGNAFNIMLAPLVQLWRSAGRKNELPLWDNVEETLRLCGSENLLLDAEESTAYLQKEGSMIDLGGIGKGFAADVCCNLYREMGASSAFINLGGNVKTVGNRADGQPWKVGIQHPDKPRGNCYCVILCSGFSVVTSGGYERFQEIGGKRFHHILDGSTGYPSQTDLKSVTVLSGDSMQADALATAAFVMGLKSGVDLIYESGCMGAVFFTTEDKVYITEGIRQHMKLFENLPCYEI